MKTFYATRDKHFYCLWSHKPEYLENNKMFHSYVDQPFVVVSNGLEFRDSFGLTLAMNECKRVKIRLEVVE